MFKTFLNKEDGHILDLSAFINFTPEQILGFYYNSWINITLDTYLQMREWFENGYGNRDKLKMWLDFIEHDIQVGSDLETLQDSEYLNTIGPYYYVPTGTQFYFSRLYSLKHDPLTSVDFSTLLKYHRIPSVDKELRKYLQTRKTAKKSIRSKDELIRDITMCVASLRQVETISQYSRYLNIFLDGRQEILDQDELAPREPAPAPQKPDKPNNPPAKFNFLQTMGISMSRNRNNQNSCADYNRNMKIYFIRCREYDKACERYKEALMDWDEHREGFIKKCHNDIQEASAKLKEALALLGIYQEIMQKSIIHPDYRNITTLDKFKRYLETGRADDLQGCMNLYEGERYWTEIKASQERIENTIYFLQPDNEALRIASDETGRLIASTME